MVNATTAKRGCKIKIMSKKEVWAIQRDAYKKIEELRKIFLPEELNNFIQHF